MVCADASGVTIPMKGLPSTLDPQKLTTIYEMVVDLQIHRSLMRFNSNLSIAPELASSFDVLDEGRRIRFKIGDHKFSNGEKLKAIHVVRTFQKIFRDHSGIAADLDYIEGARAILTNTAKTPLDALGVKALAEDVVEFTLNRPVAVFLAHLACVEAAILPLDERLVYDDNLPVGAGPYSVKSIKPGEIVLHLTNPLRQVAPKIIKFVEMTSEQAIEAALNQQVDTLDGYSIPVEQLKSLKAKGWFETVSTITRQVFIVQNPTRLSAKVRATIFETIQNLPGNLVPKPYIKSYGLIPNSLPGNMPQVEDDVIASNRLSHRVKVKLDLVQGEPALLEIARHLRAALKEKRIDLEINLIALKDYMPRVKEQCYDLLVRSKFLDYPDGMSILTYFRSHYADNTFFIADKKVDRLLDQAIGELNKDRRSELYREIQKLILSHKVVVPLVFGSDNRGLWGPRLKNVPPHPLGLQGLPLDQIALSGD